MSHTRSSLKGIGEKWVNSFSTYINIYIEMYINIYIEIYINIYIEI